MPDPRVLYIVTAVVVLALVIWVVLVLARPAREPQASPGEQTKPTSAPPPQTEKASQAPETESAEALRRRRLDSHLEIQDQPGESDEGERES